MAARRALHSLLRGCDLSCANPIIHAWNGHPRRTCGLVVRSWWTWRTWGLSWRKVAGLSATALNSWSRSWRPAAENLRLLQKQALSYLESLWMATMPLREEVGTSLLALEFKRDDLWSIWCWPNWKSLAQAWKCGDEVRFWRKHIFAAVVLGTETDRKTSGRKTTASIRLINTQAVNQPTPPHAAAARCFASTWAKCQLEHSLPEPAGFG